MKLPPKRKAARKRAASPQHTIRAVPPDLDAALRARAQQDGVSLNTATLQALRRGLNLAAEKKRDLGFLVGSFEPRVVKALEECRQIDAEMWK